MARIDNEQFSKLDVDFDGESMISLKFLDSPSRTDVTPTTNNEKTKSDILIIDEDVHH